MRDHILVPVDGSPLSRRALRRVLEEYPDASITVLHVVDRFEPGYGAYPGFETSYEPSMGSQERYDRGEEVSEQLFEEARELAAGYDREISTTSETGDSKANPRGVRRRGGDRPHRSRGARTYRRRRRRTAVFGSIAEIVARRATVPVTLIRREKPCSSECAI